MFLASQVGSSLVVPCCATLRLAVPRCVEQTWHSGACLVCAATCAPIANSAHCMLCQHSQEASYMTGQVLHPNGGFVVNG